VGGELEDALKITGLTLFPVATPPPHRGGRIWLFLRLDTDNGPHGYGEVRLDSSAFRYRALATLVEDIFEQYVAGENPYNVERLVERIYGRAGYTHYPDHTKLAILSGIEVACWDIIGKDTGRPLYALLGGKVRDRVRTYTYIYPHPASAGGRQANADLWRDADAISERAKYFVDLGFTALKLDPFQGLSQEALLGQVVPVNYPLEVLDAAESVIGAIRDTVGSACDICIGTHGQMTAAGAIRVAKRLEQFDPLWFEEPVPPENATEMAKVARATTIPITTGERLGTRYEFLRLIEHGAAAIFNFDLGQVGGVLESKKIAALAEAAYVQISPHVHSGPIVAAASAHIMLSCTNALIMEGIERFDGFAAEVLDPGFTWERGYLLPSERPGLGHELREDVVRAHAPEDAGPLQLHAT
jgi:2-dehydro-3-deoxyphosphogalactonate aldolase